MGFSLLFFPVYIVLLLPACSFLVFLLNLFCRAILFIFWKRARTHFALWPPDSIFLGHHRHAGDPGATKPLLQERLGVCRHRVGGGGGEGEAAEAECVFCLCTVEDGDEIRELHCRHVFHRACLDQWVEHGGATCPLCRRALLPPGATCRLDQHADSAEEEGLLEDWAGFPVAAFIRSSLLLW